MDWKLDRIKVQFERCLRDAGVFTRDVGGGNLVEMEVMRDLAKTWLVMAAGISEAESTDYFRVSGSRAERATTPVSVLGGGHASLLFVVRPFDEAPARPESNRSVASFGGDVPFVQFRNAFLRLNELDRERVNSIRWELDPPSGRPAPIEPWLQSWNAFLDDNPGHPSSHIHINSPPLDAIPVGRARQQPASAELRIAAGVPNPLMLILSVAVWLRTP